MAIVKILSRHSPSYRSLIAYILKESKVDEREVYTNNLRSRDIDGCVREFMENEAFRKHSRRDEVKIFHEIISFHSDEDSRLFTKEIIDDLVAKYIELRGTTGLILAASHFDKGHVHIHFCVSALHFRTGKSFGLVKAQLHELKASFQQYHTERYPEITLSFPAHGKGSSISHAQWNRERREQIVKVVRECFADAKSQEDFIARLAERNQFHYERNGKASGIEHEGLKFRFSRLLGEGRSYDMLPSMRDEEERTLAEIRAIRDARRGIDRDGYDRER